ncbi:ribosomal RNA-processing protein 8 isoform X1 [Betta splendens]|uniref:Ribosomal RNA-processing protein 8 n=1 Tax=Betta splendens TaxID=158456 RepID=A0A6P7P266_BETSP|nr:ribosomal RNA-processing protein 8 isoform X1 [Betta splendens]
MFNEDEDWNDEQDAQVLSETVLKNSQKTISAGVKVHTPKAVGKKSLLRTLQTLGAVPEWKSDSHKQSSDSEAEAPPSHSKKRKKRRKKREHAETSAEQQDNGGLEEKPEAKKKKKDNTSGAPKTNGTSADDATKSANMEVNEMENIKKLSRQQWKNKMKNKRKCKNKYRENEPEEKVHKMESVSKQGTNDEVKTDVNSKNSSKKTNQTAAKKQKKDNECKPQKLSKEDTQALREEKQQIHKEKTKNSGKAEKFVKSFPDESKLKADAAEVEITDDQQRAKGLTTELSKKQSQKRDKLRKMLHSHKAEQQQQEDEPAAPENKPQQTQPASFRSRMEQRLESARFRYINEVLYSTSSGEAKRMFKQDPQAFSIYHRGYTAQVQKWPTNPVDAIISYIGQKPPSLVVADFGCGDCKIARSVTNKVHSFDLAATCELVTVCDMANVPLADASVDIAVFCLSLMGTNLADFISEANRVLKMGGVLKISEVASRFENVRSFLSALAKLGFKTVSKDTDNTHFYSFEFVKTGNCPKSIKKSGLQLKACVYKRR